MIAHVADHLADDGFVSLLELLARDGSISCDGYKPSCLRRRLGVRVRATGAGSYRQYAALLNREPDEWTRLRDSLTINVTGFFRDRSVFALLESRVIPSLAAAGDGPIRAWSAGCASGEEAYSVAMLLAEAAGLDRVSVLATDIDQRSLARARAAEYPRALVRELPPARREAWWLGDDPARPDPRLQRCVTVSSHDLLREPPPASALQLITCRNVLIYFARAAQEALYGRFADALAIGGVLVLGQVELLTGDARRRFAPIDARARIYQRVA